MSAYECWWLHPAQITCWTKGSENKKYEEQCRNADGQYRKWDFIARHVKVSETKLIITSDETSKRIFSGHNFFYN